MLNRTNFIEHHPIILKFKELFIKNEKVINKEHISFDSLGIRTKNKYSPIKINNLPEIGEEYFEWIDIMMAIHDANDTFVMFELGAGYGRWGVRAYNLAKKYRLNCKIIFSEAEPQHYAWLLEHLKINKIPNKNIVLSNKLISDQNGKDYFYIKAPDSFGPSTPSEWYGQSKIYDWEKNIKKTNKKYFGKDVFKFDSNWSAIEIEKVDSNEFFDINMIIDLLDFDVQGEEFVIIKNSIELINNKVKRIHIGTHSNIIESQLKKLLNMHGWVMVRDYKLHQFNLTPYGNISFCDGVQSWINPRFNVTYG